MVLNSVVSRLAAFVCALVFGASAHAAADATVTEFYIESLDHYFITSGVGETAIIDSGAAGAWERTGRTFGVWTSAAVAPAGAVPVCRFYGSQSPGPNSHFYTPNAAECEGLKALQARTPATEKRWNYEGIAFYAMLPTEGACTNGLVALYRLYNNGFAQGIDSNHRYVLDVAEAQDMKAAGWLNEGAQMCVQAPPAVAPGSGERKTLQSEGVTREYWVYLPKDYNAAIRYPVMVMHHGTSGNGELFLNISGWREKAEAAKFIAVFPSARTQCFFKDGKQSTTSKWNSGSGDFVFCNPATAKDDVLFFRGIINALGSAYSIDSSRIYTSGFSNGGQMSLRLAMEASDIVAAATFSGGLHLVSGAPLTRIPTWFSVGDLDDRFTPANDGKPLPLSKAVLDIPLIKSRVGSILAAMQIDNTKYVESSTAITYTANFNVPQNGGTEREHRTSVVKGLYHQYANGKNHPLVYADVFWSWLSQYKK